LETKAIVNHKQSGIGYLNDLLFGMNLQKKDSKITTDRIALLNKNCKELE
jgi:hypothetical protein